MKIERPLVATMAEWIPMMRIVPPRHKEFNVYGNAAIQKRAAVWAYNFRYALVRNLPACAHGFYMMRCPGRCSSLRALDHAEMWIDCSGRFPKPFLLAHPYMKEPEQDSELLAYATAHGIHVERGYDQDHWYMPTAPPVRLRLGDNGPFPIEVTLPPVLTLSPIQWRCEKPILIGPASYCQRDSGHTKECSPDEDIHESGWRIPPSEHETSKDDERVS